MRLPSTTNIFEIIYKYKMPKSGLIREFYLEGEDVKEFMSQIGGASIMGITHGLSFKPLKWKIRRIEK